jgi:hypothetical protein
MSPERLSAKSPASPRGRTPGFMVTSWIHLPYAASDDPRAICTAWARGSRCSTVSCCARNRRRGLLATTLGSPPAAASARTPRSAGVAYTTSPPVTVGRGLPRVRAGCRVRRPGCRRLSCRSPSNGWCRAGRAVFSFLSTACGWRTSRACPDHPRECGVRAGAQAPLSHSFRLASALIRT